MKNYDLLKPLIVKGLVLLLGVAGGFLAAAYPAEFTAFCRGVPYAAP